MHSSRDMITRRASYIVTILNCPSLLLLNVIPSLGFFEDLRYNSSTHKLAVIIYGTLFLGARIMAGHKVSVHWPTLATLGMTFFNLHTRVKILNKG
jgi:hypothetical protein